ncbi:uncharacterized protein B0H18DRAFT_638164 [Fomitopsis serialis]|uniref:uncharacterized protein n=1 Tax=Fomitopsis serialis TaxID=139415 RepID=UPI002007A8EF|nr:uncharacterized protein B0H18DRAFT_638164 [Neoantrodia serialis]KAH9919280.1 hypothetical protein B0H18DRAFT_638164 [Neoantrodia serialis]
MRHRRRRIVKPTSKRRIKVSPAPDTRGEGNPRPSCTPSRRSSAGHARRRRDKQVEFTSTLPLEECTGWFTCSHCAFLTRHKGTSISEPDRLMRIHFAVSRGPEWVCCGVPEEDAPGCTGEMYEHGGGGTRDGYMRSFSRRDSFLRHLKKATCLVRQARENEHDISHPAHPPIIVPRPGAHDVSAQQASPVSLSQYRARSAMAGSPAHARHGRHEPVCCQV